MTRTCSCSCVCFCSFFSKRTCFCSYNFSASVFWTAFVAVVAQFAACPTRRSQASAVCLACVPAARIANLACDLSFGLSDQTASIQKRALPRPRSHGRRAKAPQRQRSQHGAPMRHAMHLNVDSTSTRRPNAMLTMRHATHLNTTPPARNYTSILART